MKIIRQKARLRGIAVSPGIVIGKAYLVDRRKVHPPEKIIDPSEVEAEVARFRRALEETRAQLQEIKAHYESGGLGEHSYLVDVHLLMLQDRMIAGETERRIRENLESADWALWQVLEGIKSSFEGMDDEYFRDRRTDLEHLGDRVLRTLSGRRHERISDIQGDVVVVAHDLSPMDTAQMDVSRIRGFVTDLGGRTSHTAILARSLNIPAVVGLETVTDVANGGDTIVVDGLTGDVVLNPTPEDLEGYRRKQVRYEALQQELESLAVLPAVTRDGHKVKVGANIELLEEMRSLRRYGAEGIGLYRTEFLYMNRPAPPDEEEQYETYRRVVEAVRPFSVTIRTLDIGGDKMVQAVPIEEEGNPALGLRSIRLCLKEKALFRTQLRAILRASAHGTIRIMFPMISGVGELRAALGVLDEARKELDARGQPYDPNVAVGAMIEVPSAAVTADLMAPLVDFFSIGTNDLIQYALAIDRVNEHVAYLYEPLHPAVLRMIRATCEAGAREGIPVAVCGEMAGDEIYTLVLLGLGVQELSMHALSIPRVKRIIHHTTLAEARDLAAKALELRTAGEVHAFVEEYMRSHYPWLVDPLEWGGDA